MSTGESQAIGKTVTVNIKWGLPFNSMVNVVQSTSNVLHRHLTIKKQAGDRVTGLPRAKALPRCNSIKDA